LALAIRDVRAGYDGSTGSVTLSLVVTSRGWLLLPTDRRTGEVSLRPLGGRPDVAAQTIAMHGSHVVSWDCPLSPGFALDEARHVLGRLADLRYTCRWDAFAPSFAWCDLTARRGGEVSP